MRLVGGVAGAVIGSFWANPQMGWMIGSAIGGLAEGPETIKQEGPRLGDQQYTSAGAGGNVSTLFGMMRKAGVVIDMSERREVSNTETQDNKGASTETESTTYTYFRDVQYLLCFGEISGVTRIWHQGKLIYDVTLDNNGFIGDFASNIVVYKGTENGDIDPTFEAIHGVGNEPAYNKMARVVFKNMNVTSYNGNPPDLQFEINRSFTDNRVYKTDTIDNTTATSSSDRFILENENDGLIYDVTTSTGINLIALTKYDLYNNELVDHIQTNINQQNGSFPNRIYKNSFVFTNSINNLVVTGGIARTISVFQKNIFTRYSENIVLPNLNINSYNNVYSQSFKKYQDKTLSYILLTKNGAANLINETYIVKADMYSQLNIDSLFTYQEIKSDLFATSQSDLTYIDASSVSLFNSVFTYDRANKKGYFTLINNNGISEQLYRKKIHLYSIDDIRTNHEIIIDSVLTVDSIVTNDMFFDDISRDLYILYSRGTGGASALIKYNIDTQTIIYNKDIGVNATYNSGKILNYNKSNREFIFADQGARKIVYLKLDDDNYRREANYSSFNFSSDELIISNIIYSEKFGCEIFITNKRLFKNYGVRLDTATYPLVEVIKEIISQEDLDLNNFQFIGLDNIQVDGYLLTSMSDRRTFLNILKTTYNFDVYQKDFKIVFAKKSTDIKSVINLDHLGAVNDSKEIQTIISKNRTPELEIPFQVDVVYADINKDYQTNTQNAMKVNTKSSEIMKVELPLVLNANNAKNIAERELYKAWITRDTINFNTSYKYAFLNTSDLVTLKLKNNDELLVKIIKKENDSGLIKFTTTTEDSSIYEQNFTGETGVNNRQKIEMISTSKNIMLDIPILRNQDNNAGVYWGTNPNISYLKWTGSSLFQSNNSVSSFTNIASSTRKTLAGDVIGVLQDFTYAYNNTIQEYLNIVDYFSYIDIRLDSSELYSITDDEFFNGANLCVIGKELIQFRDVEVIDATRNIYRLSTLIRGKFGTEWAINKHTENEQFVYIKQNDITLQRILTDNIINLNKFYKNVSNGKTTDETNSVEFINTGVGLKCYTVSNVVYARSSGLGDLSVEFKKRVRGLWTIKDNVDVTDFDIDQYIIEIYLDNTFTNVIRTINTTSLNFSYTQAQQIEDANNKANLFFSITKVNSEVGRGYTKYMSI